MIDMLAIGAHPDDIEVGCGGILIQAKNKGLLTGMLVLTRGEAGHFGDANIRMKETQAAANIMGIDFFKMFDMGDSKLENDLENAMQIASVIANSNPKIILAPWKDDYHPDHITCYNLVQRAIFLSQRAEFGIESIRLKQALYFSINVKNIVPPEILIDISDVYELKKQAVASHKSQAPILMVVETFGKIYGMINSSNYAEAFHKNEFIKINNISSLF